MNEIKITGVFDRDFEQRSINRPTGEIELTTGSLNFTAKRGDKEVKMWIDVEAVGNKAFELYDVPLHEQVTVTGRLERAAWQDKQSGEWKSKHFIRYEDAEYAEKATAGQTTTDDIPF